MNGRCYCADARAARPKPPIGLSRRLPSGGWRGECQTPHRDHPAGAARPRPRQRATARPLDSRAGPAALDPAKCVGSSPALGGPCQHRAAEHTLVTHLTLSEVIPHRVRRACATHLTATTGLPCRVGAGAGRRSAPGGWCGGRQALHKHRCAAMA